MTIERSFRDIPEGKLGESDQQSFLVSLGWSKAQGWKELLVLKRILVISEAGGGKTHECRAQRQILWDTGAPAFFLELATLAKSDLRSMLDEEEEKRLDAWLTSQSEVATFFLDSIDELKLSLGSFEQALKRLKKTIAGQLGRARFIITTRPIPFDEEVVRRLLPVPHPAEIETNGETFAQVAMHGRSVKQKTGQEDAPTDWRTVVLMPLSDDQIVEFAKGQSVDNPQSLLEDLRRRNAQEFARRPQDLIELCADWRDFKRIRTHREQVATNVRIKLKPREDRPEPAELSVEAAIIGASRLALAMITTRRLTIRHSAEADAGREDAALDPATILADWSASKRKALLERPLFGFASYGRVRFHHRSVTEYLASERIKQLRAHGMPLRALRRLIFAHTKGKIIVRPSKRPIAGWLSLTNNMIFETLRDHEPAVLLAEGDPESLTPSQRNQALLAYAERFGRGGWRGLNVPHIQVHRFASPELAETINPLWVGGVENPEIREILLHLIDMGRIGECSDIVHTTALNPKASNVERLAAIDALATLNDPRLRVIVNEILDKPGLWPEEVEGGAVLRLFPEHLAVKDLCTILARVKRMKRRFGDQGWHLTRRLGEIDLDKATLEALRDGLADSISAGLRWEEPWPHFISDRSHLSNPLAAVCVRGLEAGVTAGWLRASVLALRMPHEDRPRDEVFKQLKQTLATLPAEQNAQLFWIEDSIVQSIHPLADPWKRLAQIIIQGAGQLNRVRDWNWIASAVVDSTRLPAERAMLLEAAMRLAPSLEELRDHLVGLKSLVSDRPELITRIDHHLGSLERGDEPWEVEAAERKKKQERQEAENHASWINFWREVAERPEAAFSSDRRSNTAWNLWRAMEKAGDESREAGWNRRFIETHFGKETADRLRLTLMEQWRNDHPTLVSERPADAKGTYLVCWQLGLAAVYAESEDPEWATKLSNEEAKLAVRYAIIELNSLPQWVGVLADAHPRAVDEVLGEELRLELQAEAAGAEWHSMLLQHIGHAADKVVTAFLPRLRAWFDCNENLVGKNGDVKGAARRLQQVVSILEKHGDANIRALLRTTAQQCLGAEIPKSFAYVWLPLLMRFDANTGLDALEERIRAIDPAPRSEAVTWIGSLFGDRHDGVNLTGPQFTPSILLRLLRLVYHHVRPADDVRREGSYTPDDRDDAERARNAILNVLLKAKGEEGWAVKLEMAADPICANFKDRIIAVAEEHWAEEIDANALDEAQAIALDRTWEAPPSTNEAMFAVMTDRLEDLNELLLQDISPREAWAGIADEKVMRREIARELQNLAKGLYKIDQEAATADEKETDIRLRSTASLHEAVIELKLADERTARDLRDTLKGQLVKKYMAAETSRSGCLMITLAKNREWKNPDDGSRLGFTELTAMLRKEAESIVQQLGGNLRLHVQALDLRPRQVPEKATTVRGKKS